MDEQGTQLTPHALVLGLGRTGLSVCRFLRARGVAVLAADSRREPPCAAAVADEHPEVMQQLGELPEQLPAGTDLLVVSPGLPADLPVARAARTAGVAVVGDIELFARDAEAPVAAVTGSNGKSTVVSMLGLMAEYSGRDVRTGGNLGTPALDMLRDAEPELYVLELSSFQLELTESLHAECAAVLNVSPDHIDRHGDIDRYASAKARILERCGTAVLNRDDPRVAVMAVQDARVVTFGADAPHSDAEFGLAEHEGATWLQRGSQRLLRADALRVPGRHNQLNALAALAMGQALGLDAEAMVAALEAFAGLPHRMEWVGQAAGVTWFNDSKATNVGAAAAAISGMDRPVVLIAGGDAKGADLAPLREACAGRLRAAVLLGSSAGVLAELLDGLAPITRVTDLEAAVAAAQAAAREGDAVLLSPACASLDMFDDYADRGRRFVQAVERVLP